MVWDIQRIQRIHRIRCHRLRQGTPLPHAPGVRMTVVTTNSLKTFVDLLYPFWAPGGVPQPSRTSGELYQISDGPNGAIWTQFVKCFANCLICKSCPPDAMPAGAFSLSKIVVGGLDPFHISRICWNGFQKKVQRRALELFLGIYSKSL